MPRAAGTRVPPCRRWHVAARRRFVLTYTTSEIIRFQGQVRTVMGAEVDPLTAEQVLRSVLGDPMFTERLDEHARALAVAALLLVLVGRETLPDENLEALLAQAQVMANRMLAEL